MNKIFVLLLASAAFSAQAQQCQIGVGGIYAMQNCAAPNKCCTITLNQLKGCDSVENCEENGGTVSEPTCFSADQTVEVRQADGLITHITMEEAKVGDEVRVSVKGEYEPIIA